MVQSFHFFKWIFQQQQQYQKFLKSKYRSILHCCGYRIWIMVTRARLIAHLTISKPVRKCNCGMCKMNKYMYKSLFPVVVTSVNLSLLKIVHWFSMIYLCIVALLLKIYGKEYFGLYNINVNIIDPKRYICIWSIGNNFYVCITFI